MRPDILITASAAALLALAGCGQSGPLQHAPGTRVPASDSVPAPLPPGAQTPATEGTPATPGAIKDAITR